MLTRRPAPDQGRPRRAAMRARFLTRTIAGAGVAAVCLSLSPIQAGAATNTVDPATYVHSVCTALTNFQKQLDSVRNSSDNNNSDSGSLSDARDRLVGFLNQAKGAADTAVTDVQNSGAPKVKNGDKLAALVVKDVTDIRDAFAKAASSAQGLSTTNGEAFGRAAGEVGREIGAAGSKTGKAFDNAWKRFSNKALRTARSKDSACDSLK